MKTFIALIIALLTIAGCSWPRDNSADGGTATSYSSDSPALGHGATPRNAP